MKATQVGQEPKFITPAIRKGGNCHHCNAKIEDYHGVYVANNLYCDHSCFADYAFGKREKYGGVT